MADKKKLSQDTQNTLWHARTVEDVRQTLNVPEEGLSDQEAAERLERYGPNQLPAPQRRGPLKRFFVQFHNLLIYVLLGAAMVTALMGHWLDFGVILGVVVVNALIGFIQEGKAEKALDSIRDMLSLHAYVERDGHRREVAAEELVPGDLVLLQAGDKVPADMRLIRVKDLRVDEALLTGESQAVAKQVDPVEEDAVLGDRLSMAYSGTVVTYGRASGVVVATGKQTEIGRISEMLTTVETISTPLLRKMDVFARRLTGAIILLGVGAFAFGMLARDYTMVEMFLATVGLIVAAIPEGLPAIITITLAIGVQRMARRKAIIRRLPAVETLGAVTVICSDKTGTLTRNEMMVRDVVCADASFEVEGDGYDPHGEVLRDGQSVEVSDYPLLGDLARVGLLCNDSTLDTDDNEQWRIHGDPTEGALLTLGLKLGLDAEREADDLPRTDAIPFESEHRFMATLHHDHEGNAFIFLKGAPERVLELCRRQRQGDEEVELDEDLWRDAAEKLAGNGRRVLALAWRQTDSDRHDLAFDDISEFTLLGLVGITDPPRPEAIEAVKRCRTAGIGVKMITGDHARTALAIGRDMGIGDGERVVTGAEIEDAADERLSEWVREVDVFARTSPEHKLRLVRALQANGEISAMTGDGVNDAPALKRADVGVAMGIKGTEVSKEASEMVLADDNFASIVDAVEEGRTVYDNIRKSITFILPTNGGEAFVLLAAIALGRVMPITPVQILWINMITAVTLALSLAFEPPEKDIMTRPPRPPKEPILSLFLGWRILYVSLILLAGTFGLYIYERETGADIEVARTVAVNTLVMFEAFYLLNCRYLHRSVVSREGLLGNRLALYAIGLVVVFQLLFTYAPPLQFLFSTAPLDGAAWLRVVLIASTVFFLVELEKVLFKGLHREARGLEPRREGEA
ncbi:cation-transporting P-type ATPase [Geoalkalibacter subterraneus]|uniref:cation-transporting P-type ATPase n=1 Tax=Geoalkalibacter subterraneus TaxID=483547 RepID=UPI000693AE18|nr:cation-transporting P-type ATPase [Geoalkalibacter subterraneus]